MYKRRDSHQDRTGISFKMDNEDTFFAAIMKDSEDAEDSEDSEDETGSYSSDETDGDDPYEGEAERRVDDFLSQFLNSHEWDGHM